MGFVVLGSFRWVGEFRNFGYFTICSCFLAACAELPILVFWEFRFLWFGGFDDLMSELWCLRLYDGIWVGICNLRSLHWLG